MTHHEKYGYGRYRDTRDVACLNNVAARQSDAERVTPEQGALDEDARGCSVG